MLLYRSHLPNPGMHFDLHVHHPLAQATLVTRHKHVRDDQGRGRGRGRGRDGERGLVYSVPWIIRDFTSQRPIVLRAACDLPQLSLPKPGSRWVCNIGTRTFAASSRPNRHRSWKTSCRRQEHSNAHGYRRRRRSLGQLCVPSTRMAGFPVCATNPNHRRRRMVSCVQPRARDDGLGRSSCAPEAMLSYSQVGMGPRSTG